MRIVSLNTGGNDVSAFDALWHEFQPSRQADVISADAADVVCLQGVNTLEALHSYTEALGSQYAFAYVLPHPVERAAVWLAICATFGSMLLAATLLSGRATPARDAFDVLLVFLVCALIAARTEIYRRILGPRGGVVVLWRREYDVCAQRMVVARRFRWLRCGHGMVIDMRMAPVDGTDRRTCVRVVSFDSGAGDHASWLVSSAASLKWPEHALGKGVLVAMGSLPGDVSAHQFSDALRVYVPGEPTWDPNNHLVKRSRMSARENMRCDVVVCNAETRLQDTRPEIVFHQPSVSTHYGISSVLVWADGA